MPIEVKYTLANIKNDSFTYLTSFWALKNDGHLGEGWQHISHVTGGQVAMVTNKIVKESRLAALKLPDCTDCRVNSYSKASNTQVT